MQSFVEIGFVVMERRRKNKKFRGCRTADECKKEIAWAPYPDELKRKWNTCTLKFVSMLCKASSVSRQFVINRPDFLVVVFAWLFVFYESNDGIFEWNIESNFYDRRPIWNIVQEIHDSEGGGGDSSKTLWERKSSATI